VEHQTSTPELRPNQLYPIDVARKFLGDIGRTTFYSLVGKGEIELVRIGSRSLTTGEGLIRYIESLTKAAA
jgi:hypothetical protein